MDLIKGFIMSLADLAVSRARVTAVRLLAQEPADAVGSKVGAY